MSDVQISEMYEISTRNDECDMGSESSEDVNDRMYGALTSDPDCKHDQNIPTKYEQHSDAVKVRSTACLVTDYSNAVKVPITKA